MRYAIAGLALVVAVVACYGGNTNYSPGTGPIGMVGGGNPVTSDSGVSDAGPDAGIGDAGCYEVLIQNLQAIDNCNAGGAQSSVQLSVDTDTCSVVINFATASSPCSGAVSGVHDAFTGQCIGANSVCTAPSLPGTITCTGSSAAACTISICPDAGGC